jgi:hypothetical protein
LLPLVVPAALAFWLSPSFVDFAATTLANIGAREHFSLCLMPTNYALRDYAPAILGVAAMAFSWWRGSRKAHRAGPVAPDTAVT